MTKAVFRPGEVAVTPSRVVLDPPFPEIKKEEPEAAEQDTLDVEMFAGPTPAELQAEADRRRADWEREREKLLKETQAEARTIIDSAKKTADENITRAEEEATDKLEAVKKEAEEIIAKAEDKTKVIADAIEAKSDAAQAAAHSEGLEKGHEEGYTAGFAEVQRLVVRTQVILERLQDKRAQIFAEAEQQVIDMALLIARKVVKTISETQRNVVIENIKESLSKVKSRGKILVKVNLADLELSTAHLADFTRLIENSGNIQILEDSTIAPGGCIIETDFGEIDARITNQFAELEAKILEISPIKSRVGGM